MTMQVKEDFVGDPPLCCQSVEMLQLDDGSFEVVMRTLADRDPDSVVYSEPERKIERFRNRAQAEFRYKTVLQIMKGAGPPD
jgi:hypothetical protein